MRVQRALRDAERAWEEAVTSTSELALAIVTARKARGYSKIVGHGIIGATGKAVALAGEGQSSMATIHRMLQQFASLNGIAFIPDYGDGDKSPKGG